MRIDNPSKEELKKYYDILNESAETNKNIQVTKYIDLGTHVVRLICFSKEFLLLIEKQLTYTLKDTSSKYDATLVVWHEESVRALSKKIHDSYETRMKLRARVEMLVSQKNYIDWEVFCEDYSEHSPLIKVSPSTGFIKAYDANTCTHYYGVENLDPEEFIKEGHIFVQFFNKVLKTPTTNLVHGAAVGLDDFGILFCARGQRGKSTLAVLSMLKGFEYVSDDYLTLSKEGDNLYSYPIYSIITLSPKMYNKLYSELDGKFVSNNARKDKYVINIANYHDKFKKKYPIKICMFPEIVSDEKPSIVPCEKGRAITQLIHSTINQMGDRHDIKTIQKLIGFVKDFDYYKINLCPDIWENVECLREFTNKLKNKEKENDKLCIK